VATLMGREQAAAELRAEALTAYSRQYVLRRNVADSTGLGERVWTNDSNELACFVSELEAGQVFNQRYGRIGRSAGSSWLFR
jgi:hypothetical protein